MMAAIHDMLMLARTWKLRDDSATMSPPYSRRTNTEHISATRPTTPREDST